MSDQRIQVTARTRPDGIDIDRLALVLVELVEQLPEQRRDRLAAKGRKLLAAAMQAVNEDSAKGVA
jgi:hypothetical protein